MCKGRGYRGQGVKHEDNTSKEEKESGGRGYVQKRNKRRRNMSGWHCSRYLSNSLRFAQCRRVAWKLMQACSISLCFSL